MNAIRRRAKACASHLLRGMFLKCYLAQGIPVKGYFAGRTQTMEASRFRKRSCLVFMSPS